MAPDSLCTAFLSSRCSLAVLIYESVYECVFFSMTDCICCRNSPNTFPDMLSRLNCRIFHEQSDLPFPAFVTRDGCAGLLSEQTVRFNASMQKQWNMTSAYARTYECRGYSNPITGYRKYMNIRAIFKYIPIFKCREYLNIGDI